MPEIIRNVFRRKLRTGLTVFGITIGIFALVVLGAMAEKINLLVGGAEKFFAERIAVSEKGAAHPFSGGTELVPLSIADRMRQVPGVACVETEITMLFDPDDEFSFGMPRVIDGVEPSEFNRCLAITEKDVELEFLAGDWWEPGSRGTVVLGVDVAKHLKANLGGTVTIRDRQFRVVGLLERTLAGPDNIAFMPQEDARLILSETSSLFRDADISQRVSDIFVIPVSSLDPEVLAERIRRENPDLEVMSPRELIDPIESTSTIFNFMIFGAALVALVVGGLSIINTMVMSIAERVREIGIKKAVGATDWDILREYLLEAAIIGLLGGVIGLGLGSITVRVLNPLAQDAAGTRVFLITTRLLLGSLAFATLLGTAAGFFPAIRAARLRPVEALKAE